MAEKTWLINNAVRKFPGANRIWGVAQAITETAAGGGIAGVLAASVIGAAIVLPVLWHVYGRADAPIDISQRLGGSNHAAQERILDERRVQDERQADEQRDTAVRNAVTGFFVVRAVGIGTGGRGVYSVRSVQSVKNGLAQSAFRHGGRSSDKARITKLAGKQVFQSRERATRELARLFDSVWKPPLAGGLVGKLKGNGEVVTVDDWGAADIALLKSLLR